MANLKDYSNVKSPQSFHYIATGSQGEEQEMSREQKAKEYRKNGANDMDIALEEVIDEAFENHKSQVEIEIELIEESGKKLLYLVERLEHRLSAILRAKQEDSKHRNEKGSPSIYLAQKIRESHSSTVEGLFQLENLLSRIEL